MVTFGIVWYLPLRYRQSGERPRLVLAKTLRYCTETYFYRTGSVPHGYRKLQVWSQSEWLDQLICGPVMIHSTSSRDTRQTHAEDEKTWKETVRWSRAYQDAAVYSGQFYAHGWLSYEVLIDDRSQQQYNLI